MPMNATGPARRLVRLVPAAFGSLLFAMLFVACTGGANSPPLYHPRAKAYLESQGVAKETVAKLVDERSLDLDEVRALARYDDVPTLHLLGANAGTPADLVAKLAAHRNEEVRWGAATNPKLLPEAMVRLRTVGKHSTMNGYLARNPSLPAATIREMYWSKEASAASIAMNTSCPADVALDILEHQPEHVRAWLAWNRGLGPEIIARLDRDPSEDVARMLKANPTYQRWKKQQASDRP